MSETTESFGKREFVIVMTVIMSLIALSIDAMLPAIGLIVEDLQANDPNHGQWIVNSIFLGMSLGFMGYGPFSDAYGRRAAIFLGYVIYLVGTLVCLLAEGFEVLIVGRLLQGLGGASFRVISVSMIRDRLSGAQMARVISLIMVLFVLVPTFAPSLGQLVLELGGWRDIFGLLLLAGVGSAVWFGLRIEETWPQPQRIPLSWLTFKSGVMVTLRQRKSCTYMLIGGLVFAGFVNYLSTSQQIFQEMYGQGRLFPVYFGGLALSIACSSFANSRLVMRFPMERLCGVVLWIMFLNSVAFFVYTLMQAGRPQLFLLVAYLASTFFCFGVLFGNISAIALEPLGHIAGIANSVISSVQTLISVLVGGFMGTLFNYTAFPLVSGFMICSGVALLLLAESRIRHSGRS